MANNTTGNDWAVIKGKVFTPKNNFYGLFVVFFDNIKSTVENLSLVFSIYSETHDIQIDEPWDKFEKKIQDMIYGGKFSQSVTMSTVDKLKSDTSLPMFGSELRDNIAKNDTSYVIKQFKHLLSKSLNDDYLEMECEIEKISSEDLQQGRVRDSSQQETPTSEESGESPPDYKLAKAKLILAPVDGKLITELREGDVLLLNLIPVSMTENHILDKLKLRRPDGSGRPVAAKLVSIKSQPKGWQLLLHITENYYTKIIEEEKILVKMSPLTSGTSKIPPLKTEKKKKSSGISWIAIATVIALGMVITYFVFLGA